MLSDITDSLGGLTALTGGVYAYGYDQGIQSTPSAYVERAGGARSWHGAGVQRRHTQYTVAVLVQLTEADPETTLDTLCDGVASALVGLRTATGWVPEPVSWQQQEPPAGYLMGVVECLYEYH